MTYLGDLQAQRRELLRQLPADYKRRRYAWNAPEQRIINEYERLGRYAAEERAKMPAPAAKPERCCVCRKRKATRYVVEPPYQPEPSGRCCLRCGEQADEAMRRVEQDMQREEAAKAAGAVWVRGQGYILPDGARV